MLSDVWTGNFQKQKSKKKIHNFLKPLVVNTTGYLVSAVVRAIRL